MILAMAEFHDVASIAEVPPGQALLVEAGGREIALFNLEGAIFAIDNVCFHRGGPLSEGILDGAEVTCPWHSWTYDVRTGVCTFNPEARVDSFPVRIEGQRIWVQA